MLERVAGEANLKSEVKSSGAGPEAFKNMNSESHEKKPKEASGYRTQRK